MATPRPNKEETLAKMDADAMEAKEAYQEVLQGAELDTIRSLADWWEKWYPKAGHKRLAYILMGKELKGG